MAYECSFKIDLPWGPKGTQRLYEEAEFDRNSYFVYPEGMHSEGFPTPKATFDEFFEPITKQFLPEPGDTFYFLTPDLTVSRSTWSGSSTQVQYRVAGNCFKRQEHAKEASKIVRDALIRLHERLHLQV